MNRKELEIDRLIKDLKNKDANVRWQATYLLCDIRDKRAVEALLEMLDDKDNFIRWRAAHSLGRIDDLRVVEPLIKALEDEDGDVRWEAARSLGKMPLTATDCQEIKPLLLANVLTSKDEGVRNVSKSLMKKCRGLE